MRYNHFSTLPERAFQKKLGGYGPATLEGGGGGIIHSIGHAVESAVSGIGHAVEDVGKGISNVGVGIDKSVRKAVPGGWAMVGAVAATILTAGAASGALAAGAAAEGAGAAAAGAGAAEAAGAAGAAEAAAAGAGAAEAAGTAAGADVFGGLAGTAGETGAAAAEGATAAAGTEAAAANAALDPLSWDAAGKAALSGAGKGALMGGLSSAAQGRDPLTGALMGAATGGLGAGAGNIAGQFGAGTIGSGIAGGATGAGTGSLLSGKGNVGNAALIGGLTGGITAGIGSLAGSKMVGAAASPFVKSLVAEGINGTPSSPQRTMMYPSTYYRPITSSSSLLQNPNVTGYAGMGGLLPSFSSQYLSSQDPSQNDVQSTYDQGILKADLGAGSQQNNFIVPNYKKDESLLPHYAAGQSVMATQTNGPTTTTNELLADLGKSTPNFTLIEKPYSPSTIKTYADGGKIIDHNPEFFSEGGLNSLKHSYVKGEGDGTSDSVPAMLANGEFVIPADVVSSLGNGSNDSGSKVLSEFLSTIRAHKQKHDAKHLPPDSKGPLAYLTDAKRKSKV